jgi:hypothetical protein
VAAYERLEAALAGVEPPFAVVDLDAFAYNAGDLLRRAAGKLLRVASKSVRCRALLRAPATDDDQERRGRLLLLGKGAVLAHGLARALAAESDEYEQRPPRDAGRDARCSP